VQDHVQQGAVHVQAAIVFNEPQNDEAVQVQIANLIVPRRQSADDG
jgi:hypothetical protein